MAASLRRLRTPTLSSDAKKAKASTLNPYITQVTVNQYEHAAGVHCLRVEGLSSGRTPARDTKARR